MRIIKSHIKAAEEYADDCYTSNLGTTMERDRGWYLRKASFLAGIRWAWPKKRKKKNK